MSNDFWGRITSAVANVSVPRMWANLSDPQVSAATRNFRIAAGLEEGEHDGPPFLDGDLYKWLEGAITLADELTPQLRAQIDELADLIASVQREDGYLHTATFIAARNGNKAVALEDRFNFETYNLGHLMTAGVRYHARTGSRVLLDAGIRAADYLHSLATDHMARSAICPSHYMGVIDIYRATGEAKYLELAQTLVRARDNFAGGDDNQDRIPVREQSVAAGHAVRANYLYAGLADIAAETADTELAAAAVRVWEDVVNTKLYLTGGCGALYDGASPDGYPWQGEITRIHQAYGRAYQLPNTTAHNESCANIGMMLWSKRLHQLDPQPRYFEVIEQIAYNALLASIGTDADSYFYTNPLRQVRDLPYPLRMPGDTALNPVPPPPPSDARLRQSYLSCFCCPPNIVRTLAQISEYIAEANDAGVWVNLLADTEFHGADLHSAGLGLKITSDLPVVGTAKITITAAADTTLHVRIPQWAPSAHVALNGQEIEATPGTYLSLRRDWQVGDVLALELPMPATVVRGHRLAEEITGQVAIQRGPLVYCLESPELPPGTKLEQIAVRRSELLAALADPQIGNLEFTGGQLFDSVPTLQIPAVVLPAASDDLYAPLPDTPLASTQVSLIPYFAWGNRGASEMSVWLPLVW